MWLKFLQTFSLITFHSSNKLGIEPPEMNPKELAYRFIGTTCSGHVTVSDTTPLILAVGSSYSASLALQIGGTIGLVVGARTAISNNYT